MEYLFRCVPIGRKEIKDFVIDKFSMHIWSKELGRKKDYYIEEFNPTYDPFQKVYIKSCIPWRAKILIAQLRTNSHQLRCETGQWKRPKEIWEERVCIFCISGAVESERHFILECDAYRDIRNKYDNVLTAGSWFNLFNKGSIEKLGELIINLYRKPKCKSQWWQDWLSHRLSMFSLVDVKSSSSFSSSSSSVYFIFLSEKFGSLAFNAGNLRTKTLGFSWWFGQKPKSIFGVDSSKIHHCGSLSNCWRFQQEISQEDLTNAK